MVRKSIVVWRVFASDIPTPSSPLCPLQMLKTNSFPFTCIGLVFVHLWFRYYRIEFIFQLMKVAPNPVIT